MQSFRAVYDGKRLIPLDPVPFKLGDIVTLVRSDADPEKQTAETLEFLEKLNAEMDALNEEEPMTDEVLKKINTRVHFREKLDP